MELFLMKRTVSMILAAGLFAVFFAGCNGSSPEDVAIKAQLADPDSYRYDSVSQPYRVTYNGKECWFEKVYFRYKNGFGGFRSIPPQFG
jgi:hypothetical protein